uniref:Uncharacterized protein n=1 Tax=Vitis vinifera TaxID=29760 RepID=A5AWK1_VITVI|nr:hypothetical protein VITISV_005197 [Vitis vinifera]
MTPLPGIEPRIKWRRCRGLNLESNGAIATAAARDESNGAVAGDVVHAILNTIAEEAMNFMSYVAEVSRGRDEPNARDMGRMTSQPKAKGEMYILNDGMNMKAEIAAMERRLEELEMNQMQEVVEDFVGKQEAINAQINQRIDSMESTLNKRMDEMQNDMAQKLDILQDSISRLANLNTVQEKENSPSQPYQNSMSIHKMEAQEGESLMEKEVKTVITLSGKEVDLPTCKLEHKVESETEKENREEIKGKKKGKSIEKDGYDVNVQREPQRIVIKEEMKKHMPPPFLQALYGKIIQTKSQPLRNRHFVAKPFHNTVEVSAKIFAAAKPILAHECHFAAQEHLFRSCETHCEVKKADFATKVPFRKGFRGCESTFGTRVPFRSTVTLISQLRNGCEESIASNGTRFGFEMKKLWSFEDKSAKLNENFAAETPFGREVKNPMLQTVRDSELKRRSYSHCKQITPKCCEISLLLREFRSLFVQCYGIPPEATRYMPQAGTLRTSRWKPISQPCEFNLLLRKYFAALLSVCEISQTPFSPAKSPAGHESAETPIRHESNGVVAGDRTPNQMVPLPLPLLGTNQETHQSLLEQFSDVDLADKSPPGGGSIDKP